jgi:hypothetical protein
VDKKAAKSTFDAALEIAKRIEDDHQRAPTLTRIAESQAKAGDFDAAGETSKTILVRRDVRLYNVARAMVRTGDREQFKRTLIPCSQDLNTAYQMAGLLFEVYKNQSRTLSEVIQHLI